MHDPAARQKRSYLVVVVVRKFGLKAVPNEDTSLKGPGTCDVAHGVPTATENQGWQVEALDVVDTIGMPAHTQIEATQAIAGQTVTTALQNHSLRPVPFHDALDDRLENALVGNIVDTVTKWEVDCIVFTLADTDVAKFACSGKVFAIFVERDRHDTVGGVEGLLHAVTMVNINIHIKNSLLESQKLEDAKDDIYK